MIAKELLPKFCKDERNILTFVEFYRLLYKTVALTPNRS